MISELLRVGVGLCTMVLPRPLRVGLFAWQGVVTISKVTEMNDKYREAEGFALNMGKPLLVVGGPYGSPINMTFGFKAHGCGDVCMDLDARACRSCPTVIGDIRDIPFSDGYFGAAYASHVVEHLPTVADGIKAVEELYRVADRVWILAPSKQDIFGGWIHTGHHLWVKQDGLGNVWIEQRG